MLYWTTYDIFNIKNMDQEHKDILLGEVLTKLDILRTLTYRAARENQGISVLLLKQIIGIPDLDEPLPDFGEEAAE